MEATFKRIGEEMRETPEFTLIQKIVGRDNRYIPLALGLQVKNGSDLYDHIMYFSRFEKFKEYELNKKFEGAEDSEYARKQLEQLKRDCEGAKVKITIKIELEKYE